MQSYHFLFALGSQNIELTEYRERQEVTAVQECLRPTSSINGSSQNMRLTNLNDTNYNCMTTVP